MDAIEALGYGIFSINTFLEPQASSDEDMAKLDEAAEEAVDALATLREQMRSAPRVQIVHSRDPDSECYLDVYLDGVRVEAVVEDVDPGRGYERAYWDERIADARADLEANNTPYRQAVVEALELASDSEHIVDRFGG